MISIHPFIRRSLPLCLLLLTASMVSSCILDQSATPEDAVRARTSIQEGRAFLTAVDIEIDALVARFTTMPITKQLLREPRLGGKVIVTRAELSTAFGTYVELTPGNFQFTPGGNSLLFEYLNGIDMSLNTFIPFVNNTIINTFLWDVTSNNRGITTPPADVVTIHLTIVRNAIEQVIEGFRPSLITLLGTVSYVNLSGITQYRIERAAGEVSLTFTGTSAVTANRSNYLRVWDLASTGGTLNGAPFWRYVDAIIFAPTKLLAVWTAITAKQVYDDHTGVILSTSTELDPQAAKLGTVAYVGTGNVTLKKSLFSRLQVARVSGGPYFCSIILPWVGTGTRVVVNWKDDTVTNLLPSTDITCAKSVLFQIPL